MLRCFTTDLLKKKALLLPLLGIAFVHAETATHSDLHIGLIDTETV